MTLIATIAKELIGLFVDDGSLAVAVLAWVGVISALVTLTGLNATLAGGLLFAGLIVVLIENVLRRAQRK